MIDDEFNCHTAAVTYAQQAEPKNPWLGAIEGINKRELIENIEKTKISYAVVNAFSINWPYVAYSGLENELVILNAFQ